MHRSCSLAELKPGCSGTITDIQAENAEKDRLLQLGLMPGTKLFCNFRGRNGSPVAFTVRGVKLALRQELCRKIMLVPSENVQQKTYLLAGNPNVGKSTLFNALTGMKQHTGNWCGKTVSGAEGSFLERGNEIRLVDTPGTYSLDSETAEETAAGEIIRRTPHDCLICVCDACCLERGLVLAMQLAAFSPRTILALNLMDEAAHKRIRIDIPKLEQQLGIPVIGVSARKKHTLLPLLEAAGEIAQKPISEHESKQLPEHETLLRTAERIYQQCVRAPEHPHRRTDHADRLLTGKWLRVPLMLMLLLVTFWITLVGANYPSAVLSAVFSRICDDLMRAADWMQLPPGISGALIDGMLRGTGWVVSVMLPPMVIFFPLFTLLEDIGLLPRIAFNMDPICARCRACGKQALTMTMGFGCNAVGVTGCRIIESKRERLTAILTNALVPCNGKFPALLTVITAFFAGTSPGSSLRAAVWMTALILLSIGVTFAASAFLSKGILRGQPSSFVLELPPYRRPQLRQIIVRSLIDRSLAVLSRAVTVAAPVSLLIWLLANIHVHETPLLQLLAGSLDSFGALLGLDGVILIAFILGLPANEIILPIAVTAYLGCGSLQDYGTAASLQALLTAHGWTHGTAFCFLLLMLFHAPCATTLLTIYKETRSFRWTLAAWLLPLSVGILFCMAATWFC